MLHLSLSVIGADGVVRHEARGIDEVVLSWREAYLPGDRIRVACDASPVHLSMHLDEALAESMVLLAGDTFEFPIPDEAGRKAYGSDWAFLGERHCAHVRAVDARELAGWGNIAVNAHDVRVPAGEEPVLFPHVTTNVPNTSGQFVERNAIDGNVETRAHGSWPHESWGTGTSADPWLKIDFGEDMVIDELRIYLRADYPHDTWWDRAACEFSDGTWRELVLERTGRAQRIEVGGVHASWLRLCELHRADPDGFAGLSQIMVMGRRA